MRYKRMNSRLFSFLLKFETFWHFTKISTRSIRGVYLKVVIEMLPRNRMELPTRGFSDHFSTVKVEFDSTYDAR